MGNQKYEHKTTKAEYEQFKTESKNEGDLLHKVFMNETGKGIPYPIFLSKLGQWLRLIQRVDVKNGVQTINKYLSETLV